MGDVLSGQTGTERGYILGLRGGGISKLNNEQRGGTHNGEDKEMAKASAWRVRVECVRTQDAQSSY